MLTDFLLQIYRFLTSEVRVFLPAFETVTIFHLRDLASGRRRIVKCEDVKVFQAPHYEGLTTNDMLAFAADYPKVYQALPEEEREVKKLPRDYVTTLCYTLIGNPFIEWVESQINARNYSIQEK